MNLTPRFLSINEVLALHSIAIENQGGESTLRDRTLLESAVAMPAQQFGGQYLYDSIPEMAAAYAFHICLNHPFVDGNKRAGTAAMIAFLTRNGWSFDATADEAEPFIVQLAAGSLDKVQFTEWTGKHMREKPKMELRDFFRALSGAQLTDAMIATIAGSPTSESVEFKATLDEAESAIPLMRFCRAEIEAATTQNNQERVKIFGTFNSLLMHLYRIAEDLGYEW
jgi:death-on-curing protein